MCKSLEKTDGGVMMGKLGFSVGTVGAVIVGGVLIVVSPIAGGVTIGSSGKTSSVVDSVGGIVGG